MSEKRFIGSCAGIYDKYKKNRWLWSEWKEITTILNNLNEKSVERSKALSKLQKYNDQLKKEKEFWKGDSCNCSNYLSILSMDCQIVQEAICDLKNVIDVDTEAFKLLDELDDKFDELNQHRIKMYIR